MAADRGRTEIKQKYEAQDCVDDHHAPAEHIGEDGTGSRTHICR